MERLIELALVKDQLLQELTCTDVEETEDTIVTACSDFVAIARVDGDCCYRICVARQRLHDLPSRGAQYARARVHIPNGRQVHRRVASNRRHRLLSKGGCACRQTTSRALGR